ncbi:MAG: RteC domain-containing protein [Rikenellaceae bacterium]
MIEITDLEIDIIRELFKHPHIATEQSTPTHNTRSPFRWTGSMTDLVILLRGIVDMKSINDGKVTYEEFIPYMSRLLQRDLKNHKILYSNISKRKGEECNGFSRISYI